MFFGTSVRALPFGQRWRPRAAVCIFGHISRTDGHIAKDRRGGRYERKRALSGIHCLFWV